MTPFKLNVFSKGQKKLFVRIILNKIFFFCFWGIINGVFTPSLSWAQNVPVIERLFKERERSIEEGRFLAEENKRLKEEVDQLQAQQKGPLAQLLEKEKIVDGLIFEKEALLKQLAALREVKAGLESELRKIKGGWEQQAFFQKKELDQEKQGLLAKTKMLEDQLTRLEAIRTSLEERIEVLEERSQEYESFKKDFEALQKDHAVLAEQNVQLSTSHAALQERLGRIDTEWEGRIRSIRTEMAQKDSAMQSLQRTLDGVSGELRTANARHSELVAAQEEKEAAPPKKQKVVAAEASRKEILVENRMLLEKIRSLQGQIVNVPQGGIIKEAPLPAGVPTSPGVAALGNTREVLVHNRELSAILQEKNAEIRALLNDKKRIQSKLAETVSTLDAVNQQVSQLQQRLEKEKNVAEEKYVELKRSLEDKILELEAKLQQQGNISKRSE